MRPGFDPWVGKIPWRRKWQPTPVLWKTPWTEEPGSYSPWGRKESDTTERLHFPFLSLFCCTSRPHFVCLPSNSGQKQCFHFLTVANSAAMIINVQMALQDPAFNSLGYVPGSGSCGSSVFNFLRNCRTVFFNNCTVLCSC